MKYLILTGAMLAVLMVAVIGCSNNTPTGPLTDADALTGEISGGEPVQLAARVETTNQARSMLTFVGTNDTGVMARNCIIVRLNAGEETPVPFTNISPWDSVDVNGFRQQNGYVLMHRIQIIGDSCFDVAFRDTITAIDYGGGTFAVAGRAEVIHVDESTLIWGNLIDRQASYNYRFESGLRVGQTAGDSPGYHWNHFRRDTVLAFTDLQVGDIVEVRANIVDEANLMAVAIKLVNDPLLAERCTKFEATLATIDLETRTVTFDENDWVGIVCPGAKLLDVDGTPIALDAFATGEYVYVKGMEQEDGSLKICLIQKL